MTLIVYLVYGTAAYSTVLGLIALLRQPKSLPHLTFAVGMWLLAAEAVLVGLSAAADTTGAIFYYQNLRMVVVSALPGVWFLFSACYARGDYRESVERTWPVYAFGVGVPLSLAIFLNDLLITRVSLPEPGTDWALRLDLMGVVLNVVILVGVVLILMNFERTFRGSVGTMRWQIKFMLLGLGILFVVRVYTCSQILLYSSTGVAFQTINVFALLLACPLITVALIRSRDFAIEIYPSRAVLQGSLTIILVAIYLLAVGWLANLATALGGTQALPIKALIMLGAIVALSLFLMSDRVQQRTRRFLSRHFSRPLYDYRKLWTAFTARTSSVVGLENLAREAVKLVSDTFQVLSVTMWVVDDKGERMGFAASSLLSEAAATDLMGTPAETGQLIAAMRDHPHPIDIDHSKEGWAELLQRCNPDFFHKGGGRLCVPLVAGQECLGLLTLADRVNGVPFSAEDLDVLKCIADQVAASLLNVRLSQSLLQAKEMEAFQTMSAFFVHDLKNTASTLSLMLQNLPQHFDDPAFREDALRAVSKSVAHLNELIGRLTALRHSLDLKRVEADLNQVVTNALAGIESAPGLSLNKDLQPLPKAVLDPEQIKKVIVNLLLNAKEALGKEGQIRIQTSRREGWVVVAVSDNGCGISLDFIRNSLFRPFRTTKKRGIGIGLYHSRVLVEAHRGKIEVESELGKGTTFRVLLPLESKAA